MLRRRASKTRYELVGLIEKSGEGKEKRTTIPVPEATMICETTRTARDDSAPKMLTPPKPMMRSTHPT
jgi:hypothetical protein